MPNQPNNQQYFVAVPMEKFIKEQILICEQEISGAGFLIMHNAKSVREYWKGKRDALQELQAFLKPISLEERDKEVAGKAWDACENNISFPFNNHPNKEQYIQSIK